jgi:hypothetical protein
MALLEVLGVGLWAVLGFAGAWVLITGRKLMYGLPKGIREGWPLRLFGLAYFAVALFLVYQALHGSFSADSVVFTYAFFCVAGAVALSRRRKAPATGGTASSQP